MNLKYIYSIVLINILALTCLVAQNTNDSTEVKHQEIQISTDTIKSIRSSNGKIVIPDLVTIKLEKEKESLWSLFGPIIQLISLLIALFSVSIAYKALNLNVKEKKLEKEKSESKALYYIDDILEIVLQISIKNYDDVKLTEQNVVKIKDVMTKINKYDTYIVSVFSDEYQNISRIKSDISCFLEYETFDLNKFIDYYTLAEFWTNLYSSFSVLASTRKMNRWLLSGKKDWPQDEKDKYLEDIYGRRLSISNSLNYTLFQKYEKESKAEKSKYFKLWNPDKIINAGKLTL
ncbi:MAG: hypothetical protein JW870_12825 [Candidatus Delongbacteria bacterium]|nr:hypothetical protein [Candidatus Delongbacteria bacterium]